jgi:hypothetical protein
MVVAHGRMHDAVSVDTVRVMSSCPAELVDAALEAGFFLLREQRV